MADIIGTRWTHAVVEADVREAQPATAVIGTYHLYRQLDVKNLAGVVICHGDAMLNLPDFSAEERAWQYLARVHAAIPDQPLLVQTFHPEHDFWQRWSAGDDAAWYQSERDVRRRMHVPPATEQWIARLPAGSRPDVFATTLNNLKSSYGAEVELSVLPPNRQHRGSSSRILLSARDRPIGEVIDGQRVFPTPWQVETVVNSWLD